MNATVTKAAKSTKKAAPKPIATSKTKLTTAKSAVKSTAKSLAGSVVKALSKSIKPASKTVAAAAKKAVAKSAVKSPAKSKAPVATRASAAKTTKTAGAAKTPAKKTAKTATSSATKTAVTASKPALTATTKTASRSGAKKAAQPAAPIVDKIEPSVVSKASEVATKTSKAQTTAPGALLTEEQILKMGEKDYMNEAQLAFFKDRLQQLEKELLKNADETTEHLRETVLVPDPADRATIEEEHALELRTRDRERKLLKKVQQSIVAIDAGDYGWCEETGEPIGVPRLLARPTATLSLEAQQRRELKQKLYGD